MSREGTEHKALGRQCPGRVWTERNLINVVWPLFALSKMTDRGTHTHNLFARCGFEWKPICAQRVVDATLLAAQVLESHPKQNKAFA